MKNLLLMIAFVAISASLQAAPPAPSIEVTVTGDGAVQSRLEERRPLVGELVRAAGVALADARHAAEHGLAAVHVLDGRLAEEEVDVVVVLHRAHEARR